MPGLLTSIMSPSGSSPFHFNCILLVCSLFSDFTRRHRSNRSSKTPQRDGHPPTASDHRLGRAHQRRKSAEPGFTYITECNHLSHVAVTVSQDSEKKFFPPDWVSDAPYIYHHAFYSPGLLLLSEVRPPLRLTS